MEGGEVQISPLPETGGETDSRAVEPRELEVMRGFRSLFTGAQVLGGILVFFITLYNLSYKGGFAWRSNPHQEFNWHPFLTTIGTIYLFGNGLLMFRSRSSKKKRSLKMAHTILLFVVFVLTLIGIVAAFDAKNYAVPPKANLQSLHSWFGIITIVGFSLQWIAGFVTFLCPGLPAHLHKTVLPFHTYFSIILFIMACVSAATGFAEKKRGPRYEGLLINLMGLFLMLFAFIVIYLVTHIPYKRQCSMKEKNLFTKISQ